MRREPYHINFLISIILLSYSKIEWNYITDTVQATTLETLPTLSDILIGWSGIFSLIIAAIMMLFGIVEFIDIKIRKSHQKIIS